MVRKTLRAAAVLGLATVAAGCGDVVGGVVGVGGAVTGVEIRDAAGNTLATVDSRRVVLGSLTVPVGGQLTLQVSLRDRGGGVLQLEDDELVTVSVTNTVLLGWQQTSLDGGVTRGTLVGRSQGTTSIRVGWLDGSLVRYESPAIPVTVN